MNQSTEAWNAGILIIVGSLNNILCGVGVLIVPFDPELVVAGALIRFGGLIDHAPSVYWTRHSVCFCSGRRSD